MNDNAGPGTRSTSRASIFIAIHVAAVTLLYGVALLAGGGYASPPFPPQAPSIPFVTTALRPERVAVPEPDTGKSTLILPVNSDIAPPWTFDLEGRARFAER